MLKSVSVVDEPRSANLLTVRPSLMKQQSTNPQRKKSSSNSRSISSSKQSSEYSQMLVKTAKRKSTFRETSSVRSVTNENFTTINQYIMIRKLGSGSYGSVYLCRDKESSEEFAIKIIKRSKLKNVNGFKA